MGTVWDGSRLRSRRLSGFILMRWAVRDGMTQLLGLWLFGEIEDQYSFFKLFVRLKLMPFSVMLPRIRGIREGDLWASIYMVSLRYNGYPETLLSECEEDPVCVYALSLSMCIKKGNRRFNRRKALIEGKAAI